MLPFTIRVVDRLAEDSEFQALRIKLDPGSKTTGIALVRETENNGVAVVNLFDLIHRGRQISEALTARRGHRRLRRSKLRYRAPRFDNRGNQQKLAGTQPATPGRYDTGMGKTYWKVGTDSSHQYRTGEVRHAGAGKPRH